MKIRNIIRKYKAPLMGVGAVSALTLPTFAAESTMTTVLVDSFSTMISDMMLSIAAIVPVVLPLLGTTIIAAFGIKWFKKITGIAT